MKKAILVVSFGTSFDETREKTIGAIEKEIAKEFPDYIVKRAFTSGVIMNNLAKRGIIIPNVVTALEELSAQGVQMCLYSLHILFRERNMTNLCQWLRVVRISSVALK